MNSRRILISTTPLKHSVKWASQDLNASAATFSGGNRKKSPPAAIPSNSILIQLQRQVQLHRQGMRHWPWEKNNLQIGLGLIRTLLDYCKNPLHQNWQIPRDSSLEKWRGLCCCRNILLPTLLRHWRNGSTCQPLNLPTVLPQVQRSWQYRTYWKAFLRVCYDRHSSVQQAQWVHLFQGWVCWVQLSLADWGVEDRPKLNHFYWGYLGWRR